MEISIYNQLLENLYSLLLGFFCWIVYEIIKQFRMIFYCDFSEDFRLKMSKKEYKRIKNPINIKIKGEKKIKFIVTLIFDLIFFFILSIAFSVFIYIVNGGVFRWYIFAFSFMGFVISKVTIGRLLNRVFEHINYYFRVLVLLIITPIKNKYINIRKKIKAKREEKSTEKAKKEKEKLRNILISYGK